MDEIAGLAGAKLARGRAIRHSRSVGCCDVQSYPPLEQVLQLKMPPESIVESSVIEVHSW